MTEKSEAYRVLEAEAVGKVLEQFWSVALKKGDGGWEKCEMWPRGVWHLFIWIFLMIEV